jgi:hypothetical protein
MKISRRFLDGMLGAGSAGAVAALGWLELDLAATPDAADSAIRTFGTLMTVLFGAIAALWWNQSARLPADDQSPPAAAQQDANALNAAAAIFTVLSLFCSVFAGSPWTSSGSMLSALAALVVLASSGADVRGAASVTFRLRPLLREVLLLALIAAGAVALIWHIGT